MFGGYDRAFDLLGIRDTSVRFGGRGGGGGGGGGGLGPSLQGWANKDMQGNSSVAARNRRIFEEQFTTKTREAYEHDLRKDITNEIQGENSNTPLTDAQKEERDKRVEEGMKEYDGDKKKQTAAADKYNPALSSNEQSKRRQADEAQAKDNAREAMRDYVKEQEKQAKDAGKEWTHDDAEKARKDYKQQQDDKKGGDGEADPETKANTEYKAAEQDAAGNDGGAQTVQQQINTINTTLQNHESRITALENSRYG